MSGAGGRAALVLGGSGFVGSHVAARLVKAGYRVTVVDGLLPRTGGARSNLEGIEDRIRFIESRVELVGDLAALVAESALVVDSMAWTSHLDAFEDPEYDLELNAACHLSLIHALRAAPGTKVVYLGSRGQYGNPPVDRIDEDTAMVPEDVQGIHKLATESYFRVFARRYGFGVASLRFANCYGPRQRVSGGDIGLVGSFIRSLLLGEEVVVYGDRTRPLVHVEDIAEIVARLAERPFTGFVPFNVAGTPVRLAELAEMLREEAGSGSVRMEPIPDHLRAIDIGGTEVDQSRLEARIGTIPRTDLRAGLAETVRYFDGRIHDLAV